MGKCIKQAKNTLFAIIQEMATRPELFARCPGVHFTRKRDIDFETLVRMLISIGGGSLNKEIYDYFRLKDYNTPTKSAFVQQRDKLLPEALGYLLEEYNQKSYDRQTLDGWHLYAVDGSDFNIALNPDSDTYFQKQPHNQFHVNAIYDILNHTYTALEIQPSPKMNEHLAAVNMISRTSFPHKSLLIADRGYGGLNTIEHINRTRNLDYLIRIKNTLWKETASLPQGSFDRDIEIEVRTTQSKKDMEAFRSGKAKWIAGGGKYNTRTYSSWDFESPFRLKIRIVRFKLASGEYETIATSLNRFAFPPSKIKYLYHLRWDIETSFRDLKYAIGTTHFHAKKEESVLQEIYARVILYNLCSRVIKSISLKRFHNRKWEYKINFSMAVIICRDYLKGINKSPPEEDLIRYVEPVRPGRQDKRKIKPKSFVSFIYRVA